MRQAAGDMRHAACNVYKAVVPKITLRILLSGEPLRRNCCHLYVSQLGLPLPDFDFDG